MNKILLFLVSAFTLQITIVNSQCVTTPLSFNNCPGSAGQSFVNQGGANNGSAPAPTCNFGTGSASTST